MNTINILIGGEAGQGLVSTGNILLQAIAQKGWFLYATQDYESRIRGGHNFFQIRVSQEPVSTMKNEVDILVSLDKVTYDRHKDLLAQDAVVIFDPEFSTVEGESRANVGIPFGKVATDNNQPRVMANAVAAGAIWGLLSDDFELLASVLANVFASKGAEIIAGNHLVAQKGFEIAKGLVGSELKLAQPSNPEPRMLLKGNDALPLGALASGLQFMSAYPMTPSTGVTEFVATHSNRLSVVMEQAEDEISAINMAIGASYTGVRAMTATSGGGFALMTEALSLAGAAEIPIVVINAQRPGPSTGLPTRTEQGDLLFAFGTSTGDFPKAIFAPGDVEDAFYLMCHAFNIADKYQMPVIVLSDQHLADSYQTIEPLDLEKVKIERGLIVSGDKDYKRYAFTETGISPRQFPNFGEGLVVSAGDEHDEYGHLTEDATIRKKMMEKRMAKMILVQEEALDPLVVGDDDPEIVLIGWGSTKGALLEAAELFRAEGKTCQIVHLTQVYPLSKKLEDILNGKGSKYVVESNYTGHLEKLLAMEFGWKPTGHVRRYDGRPISPSFIVEKLQGRDA